MTDPLAFERKVQAILGLAPRDECVNASMELAIAAMQTQIVLELTILRLATDGAAPSWEQLLRTVEIAGEKVLSVARKGEPSCTTPTR